MQINEYIIFLILITVILILLFPIAKTIDLVDRPSDRKSHAGNIPLTGGLAIGIYLLILVKYFEFYTQIEQIFIYGFLICLIGSVDDKCNISVSKKLLFQSITVLILIYESNLLLNNLGYFKYLGLLSLGKFNIIFTLLCVILLINAVNYSDGIDGNASFITISSLLIIFFLINDIQLKKIIILLVIPIFVFVLFNLSILKLPKIFLGDSGSMLIGLVLSFLIIFLQNKNILDTMLLIWTISYFVFEFISTTLTRLINKKNIFLPGNDHLHFFIKKKTNSNIISVLIVTLLNIVLALVGINIYLYFGSTASALSYLIIFIIFFFVRKKISL